MALARHAGQRVVVVTATAGEHGTDDPGPLAAGPPRPPPPPASWPPASPPCGVHEHHWLGYADGECADVPRGCGRRRHRPDHRRRPARHHRDLRSRRHDRPPRPPRRVGLDDGGVGAPGPLGAALVRHPARLVPRGVGRPERADRRVRRPGPAVDARRPTPPPSSTATAGSSSASRRRCGPTPRRCSPSSTSSGTTSTGGGGRPRRSPPPEACSTAPARSIVTN